jgi:CRISPR-associated endonuclease Cas3-HD
MSATSFWAHSAPNSELGSDSRAGWQLLSVHLESVAHMARQLASAARPLDDNLARLAGLSGLLHDFGKYTNCFQNMLQTGQGRCQHAIHGAILAYFGSDGSAQKPALNTVSGKETKRPKETLKRLLNGCAGISSMCGPLVLS